MERAVCRQTAQKLPRIGNRVTSASRRALAGITSACCGPTVCSLASDTPQDRFRPHLVGGDGWACPSPPWRQCELPCDLMVGQRLDNYTESGMPLTGLSV